MMLLRGLQSMPNAGRYAPPSKAALTLTDKLRQAVSVFREVDTAMPSSYILMFLTIAMKPGHGSSVYARELDMVQPVASRIILELGQKTRSGGPGYELLDATADDKDFRLKRTYLTKRGNDLYRAVLAIWGVTP